MERKISTKLKEWKSNPDHKPLLITGCRQIGKTYSVLEFAEKEYSTYIYINFEITPEKKMLFEGSIEHNALISKIMMSENIELHKRKSLIILDEIQNCPDAYSALRPLSFNKDYDVIALGSFLGVNLDDDDERISPMGNVNIIRMHPMDFEEYLWAVGINKDLIKDVKNKIQSHEKIPEYFNKVMTDNFRRYVVVGGMPAAVSEYSNTSDYVRTSQRLDELITILKKDAVRYSRKAGRAKINACFDSIPNQLSRQKKQFRYADVEKRKGVGKSTYANSLEWLENLGLAIRCKNITKPVMPLSEHEEPDSFKMYLADTGILMRLMKDVDPSTFVLNDPYVNYGSLMENAVASALLKKNYELRYYQKRDSTLEIDFVIGMKGITTLIEVKSGRNKRAKSLSTLMSEKNRARKGYKIMDCNVDTEPNGIIHLPLYAASFLEDREEYTIPPTDDADEINRKYREYLDSNNCERADV